MNTTGDWQKDLMGSQILVGAMAAGLVFFTGFALCAVTLPIFEKPIHEGNENLALILLIVLGAMGCGQFVAFLVLRRLMLTRLRPVAEAEHSDEEAIPALVAGTRAFNVIGAALAEGFGLFGSVVFLLTGSWPALAASVLGVIWLLAQLPTREKYRRLAAELRRMEHQY